MRCLQADVVNDGARVSFREQTMPANEKSRQDEGRLRTWSFRLCAITYRLLLRTPCRVYRFRRSGVARVADEKFCFRF